LICLAALIAALALAACGGGDDGGGSSSDEERIEALIEDSVGTDDPSVCTKAATLNFLEQTELEEGEAAIDSCVESTQDPSDDPDSVAVSAVKVDGKTATANVAYGGGSFDGQSLSVSLVDEDGWKLDRIEDLIDFDPRLFGSAFAANPPDEVTEERAQCLGDELATADPDELEAAILSGDPTELAPYFAPCPG